MTGGRGHGPGVGSRLLAVALQLALASTVMAAPGIIANSHVRAGSSVAEISVEFRCSMQYLNHSPQGPSDTVRIRLESTGICTGVSPTAAATREQYRPQGADDARLLSIEYDGVSFRDPELVLSFTAPVRFEILSASPERTMIVRVYPQTREPEAAVRERAGGAQRVGSRKDTSQVYAINLESSLRNPGVTPDGFDLPEGVSLYVVEALIDGRVWYRTRVGPLTDLAQAERLLTAFSDSYPAAWVDRMADGESATATEQTSSVIAVPAPDTTPEDFGKIEDLIAEGRRAMIAGQLSRAVQLYTKILQQPPSPYHRQAQEFLALAREKNGQIAHAKAEYERYIGLYPEGTDSDRVRQRLAALIAASAPSTTSSSRAQPSRLASVSPSNWRIRTFFSQFYRRDVNQLNDQQEIVSQSSLYSDLNVDARYGGERFDFSSRLTAGHRHDMLTDTDDDGNDLRVSYAFVDLNDAVTGMRGRLGRQTRNTGGVLGRFDGLNLGYALGDRLTVEAVAGKPVYSTADGVDDARSFYGLSSSFGPSGGNVDFGVFYLQQTIDESTDRQAVGAEFRYFGEGKSLWGVADFDLSFGELASLFLQGSIRLPSQTTLTTMIDHRHSPFLSAGNALLGTATQEFTELASIFTDDEIRELALDRSPMTTTLTLGLSQALSPTLQFNINASHSAIEASPASGGVEAVPSTSYSYYSTDLVASNLLREQDVGIIGVRYSRSNTAEVYSVNLDARFPFGRSVRLSPRLRIDNRLNLNDGSRQWTYSPELRMQLRFGRRLRIELEAGQQYARRDSTPIQQDRDSWFVNLGYQFIY